MFLMDQWRGSLGEVVEDQSTSYPLVILIFSRAFLRRLSFTPN